MASIPSSKSRPRILIVGGGYLGLYTAKRLQQRLRRGEATITVVDPYPYMTYAPFLPETAASSIEPRHVVVDLRRNLPRAQVVTGKVVKIDHDRRRVTVHPGIGEDYELAYDQIVVAAGSVPRTLPIPGLAEQAIALKRVEEAVAVRDKLLDRLAAASSLPDSPVRRRALTFVVVGGGFNGVETLAELEDFARTAVREFEGLTVADLRFVLIEAAPRIMPEVGEDMALWVLDHLRGRGIDVYLETFLQSCVDGKVEMSNGETFEADTIVWSAGVKANPIIEDSGLPLDKRHRVRVRADLRVESDEGVVEGAWAAGDVAAVPDLTGTGPGGYCAPNAQNALRQAPVLADNVIATLRGGELREYYHKNLGAVAGLGLHKGVATVFGKVKIHGFPAWLMHRGYHGLAIPTINRKFRVFSDWMGNAIGRRDVVSMSAYQTPRAAFEEAAASGPKPKIQTGEPAKAGAAAKPAAKASRSAAQRDAQPEVEKASAN